MNCKQVQSELLLCFGQQQLAVELQSHLVECDECQMFWMELNTLAKNVESDEMFYPDENTKIQMIKRVEHEIDDLESKNISDVRSLWKMYIPTAAAVILLVGASLIVYMFDLLGHDNHKTEMTENDSIWVNVENSDHSNLDDNDIEYLLYEFATDKKESASEWFLDDLTEEELEYLERNFNVRDIL